MRHVWYYITILYVMYMVIILKDIMVIMVIILLYYIIYYYIRYICHVSPTLLLYYYITIFIAIYYYYCIILLYYIILYYIILYYYYIITILLLYYVLYWSFFEAPFHLSIPSDWRGRTLLLCSAHHDGRRFLWSAATTQFHWWYMYIYIFHFIYGMSSSPLTNSYFSKWLKPPTIYIYICTRHTEAYIHIISPNIDWF